MGNEVTHATFSLSFRIVDQGHPLDYRVQLLCTRMLCASEPKFKVGESKVHSPIQSSTLLTDYHISWYVASTFKRLTTTSTDYSITVKFLALFI